MTKKIPRLLTVMAALGGAVMLFGEEPAKANQGGEGTLMVQGKNYQLKHALAYETTIDDNEVIAVVVSGQAIFDEELKAVQEGEKEGGGSEFRRPFLKLEFAKSGELQAWSASADNASLGRRSGSGTGALKLEGGRVRGQANQPNDGDEMFASAFDVRFDAVLLKAGEALPESMTKKRGPAANVKPTVTGLFKGNGKEAKLAYVSARWTEPFSDKPSIKLIFTEKDPSRAKKPDFDAVFGKLGSALIISLHEDGGIFGCQVVHMAHEKQGFSSIGRIKTENFDYANGQVEGELTTEGEADTFGETWEVKLKFVAPLGETPTEFQTPGQKKSTAPAANKSAATPKIIEPTTPDEDESSPAEPAADQLKVKDLALTKDATDLEYKTMVEHVLFKSKSNVKAVCAELTANLKAQGWSNDGRDLVTPQSSILKRKRGEAALTIFVKPEGGGSEVKIFTEGLSWEGQ